MQLRTRLHWQSLPKTLRAGKLAACVRFYRPLLTMPDPWEHYFADVYGQQHAKVLAADPPSLGWYYLSAPLARPVKVWYVGWPQAASSSNLEGVFTKIQAGDGFVKLYEELGFFFVSAAEPRAMVMRGGTHWVEVLRLARGSKAAGRGARATALCSLHENDRTGVWYYAAHGSGFYLDLGRVLDHTCSHPPEGAQRGVARNASLDSLRLRCDGREDGERCQARECIDPTLNLNVESGSGGISTCAERKRWSSGELSDVSPPMLASLSAQALLHRTPRLSSAERLALPFESLVRWPPRVYRSMYRNLSRTANLKEVVDLRPHGTPACTKNATAVTGWTCAWCDRLDTLLPCGGACPQARPPPSIPIPRRTPPCGASTQYIRTGWEASGGRCAECSNDARRWLNCGPRQEPFAAHAKSTTLFNRTWPASVVGRCLHADGSYSSLRTPSLQLMLAEVRARGARGECPQAYFWWPPEEGVRRR